MKLRELTKDEVIFEIEAEPEDIPVRGHFDSGDDAQDRADVEAILARLERDDIWAWCHVTVRAKWKGYLGTDMLGCCSYESEADFIRANDYYADMCEEALADLNAKLARLVGELSELRAPDPEDESMFELDEVTGSPDEICGLLGIK